MLNHILQERKLNHLAEDVRKQEESSTEDVANPFPGEVPSLSDDSSRSGKSDSTVLYNMNISREAKNKRGGKEDFLDSDTNTSSSEVKQSREKTQSTDTVVNEEKNEKNEESNDEVQELEKLLRMTDIPKSRPPNTPNEDEKQQEREKKPAGKKEPEISLIDCMDSETENNDHNSGDMTENNDTGTDYLITMNDQMKKSFLQSSDESPQSEEPELEEQPAKKRKKKSKQKKQDDDKRKKHDDLSEFRVPNLIETDEEDEENLKDKEEIQDDSDDSVQCVQFVKKRAPTERKQREQSTDSDSDQEVQQIPKTELSPSKGRKNIKKILKKEYLQLETKQALKMENERKKRVKEREELFKSLFQNNHTRLVLDFDPQTKKELVVVDESLSQQLKPHQKEGVRFMWNSCFESLERLEQNSGSGCVLAHCMGLGKTLQVITLIHTVLTHNTGVHTALVICPLNTLRNWMNEFQMWLSSCRKKIKLIDLSPCKSISTRTPKIRAWMKNGGVLMISYEMFRTLIKPDNKKPCPEVFSLGLLDPGADLVVCDEGHVLKNNKSLLSMCVSRIKSLRRIILTGTPLQNNLTEYYCMVQFVKPNILGTLKEFRNRFVHPIENGQFEDSTEQDVRLMKRRAHVLHTMLDGFIQRYGYYVLRPFLPEKQEYVISIALTESQDKVYRLFISQSNQEGRTTQGLLSDFHWLQKVWTHPRVMWMHANKHNMNELRRSEWEKCLKKEEYGEIESSGKLTFLFNVLKRSKDLGDKVLVFSQSLVSLKLIEHFLQKLHMEHQRGLKTEFADRWVFGEDYFRLDGSTSSEHRDFYCQKFNFADNSRFRLFLVSTRAGGLGINLVAANRVVVFDASWNPTHDTQSIFRVYRFGQKKPCFIYRLLAAATMEEKIYRRQVTKLSLAHRILDEHQIERHYTMGNLQELYTYEPIPKSQWEVPKVPKDKLFAEILATRRDLIVGYHEHDSLLENKEEEELTEEERKAAWEDYEKEKLTPEFSMNGNPDFLERFNQEGFNLIQRYQTVPNSNHVTPEGSTQMCKIVDVRTLQNVGNAFGDSEFQMLSYNNGNLQQYNSSFDTTGGQMTWHAPVTIPDN